MSTISTKPPFEVVTPNDLGAPVTIVNCILIIFSGIVVIARGLTRLHITKLKAIDDVAIAVTVVSLCEVWCDVERTDRIVMQVFAIAQTVCMQLARNHGLGKHRDRLSSHAFDEYSKVSRVESDGVRCCMLTGASRSMPASC